MNSFNFVDKMCLSIMAGILIGMACLANLLYGGVLGAFLFAFGLSAIIYFKFYLYTGAIGNVVSETGPGIMELLIILIGNFLGIILFAVVSGYAGTMVAAGAIVAKYAEMGFWRLLGLSIFCGICVYIAVTGERNIIKIILCVMMFVLCGFPHCIAAFGYILLAPGGFAQSWVIVPMILGNSIGAILTRICNWKEK